MGRIDGLLPLLRGLRILIDSAAKFGLVRGGPKVNVARAEEVLERGKALGYTPAEDAVERLTGLGSI